MIWQQQQKMCGVSYRKACFIRGRPSPPNLSSPTWVRSTVRHPCGQRRQVTAQPWQTSDEKVRDQFEMTSSTFHFTSNANVVGFTRSRDGFLVRNNPWLDADGRGSLDDETGSATARAVMLPLRCSQASACFMDAVKSPRPL
jgi:hypothetical protein